MDALRSIGRTEVLIGLGVIAVLVLIAVPLVLSSGRNGARAEVPLYVDSIREAEVANEKAFGDYVSSTPAPRGPSEVGPDPVPWTTTEGFTKIGWNPAEKFGTNEIYGSYKVAATDKGFVVTGTCDIDGDGDRATWTATEQEAARPTSADDVY